MTIILATVGAKRGGASPARTMCEEYVKRSGRFAPTSLRSFTTEADLLVFVEASAGRTAARLVLADSTGKQMTSEEFAQSLGASRDGGTQLLVLAIGPADGWSPTTRARAVSAIAFGKITLPHELAAVVLAEQTYRALTILAGHPYHCGH